MTPRPALCVINFNGGSHLSRSLPAVGMMRDQFASLLLVDNRSTDDSVRFAREQCPFMQILELDSNRGPGAARNQGLRHLESQRILFIDNDVILDSITPPGWTNKNPPGTLISKRSLYFAPYPATQRATSSPPKSSEYSTLRRRLFSRLAAQPLQPLRQLLKAAPKPAVEADLELRGCLLARRHNCCGLIRSRCHRLFDQHMHPSLQCCQSQ